MKKIALSVLAFALVFVSSFAVVSKSEAASRRFISHGEPSWVLMCVPLNVYPTGASPYVEYRNVLVPFNDISVYIANGATVGGCRLSSLSNDLN